MVALQDAGLLQQQGFVVAFACGRGGLEGNIRAKGIRFHSLYLVNPEKYPRWIRYLAGIPITTILLLFYVMYHKYDCLYVQHRQSGIPSILVSRLTGAKYIFIAHNELGQFNHGRLLTPLGNHIIAVSAKVKDNAVHCFQIPAHNIAVIVNATQTEVVKADELSLSTFNTRWSIPPEAPTVAYVAMLVEIKAHDILFEAWRMVLCSFPQAILILAGEGPLKGRLQHYCAHLGIKSNVRFLGYVDDLSLVYSRADCTVLSSRSEGLPLSILESFAYGLPAVATAVSGIPEIVHNERTGLLVEPDNPNQLADALNRLLAHADLRRELGAAGRRLVEQSYSLRARERALGNYFRCLLSRSQNPMK
jgi:glycosyltransferase involved in cell wall biosynthesis